MEGDCKSGRYSERGKVEWIKWEKKTLTKPEYNGWNPFKWQMLNWYGKWAKNKTGISRYLLKEKKGKKVKRINRSMKNEAKKRKERGKEIPFFFHFFSFIIFIFYVFLIFFLLPFNLGILKCWRETERVIHRKGVCVCELACSFQNW